jgi:hypothetical protein
LLKNGGRTLKQKLYKVRLKIQDKEQLPTQWNEGIVCPVYKKGDRLKYNNYRPIKLLNIAFKIFAMLLNKTSDS